MKNSDLRSRIAAVWLSAFFNVAKHAPWFLRLVRPLIILLVPIVSNKVRSATRSNAVYLIGKPSRKYSQEVVGSFYDFVADIGRTSKFDRDELLECIAEIDGEDAYRLIRQSACGAVIVTAHMGSFEIGLAALTKVESAIHVVFKRDEFSQFDSLRSALRKKLGVIEAPIDDGWSTLVSLRDALSRNEVVVMQADRAMQKQKSREVKIGSGILRLPVGPITLATIHQSPLIPVFTTREPDGRFRVHIEPAIDPTDQNAIEKLGKVIEKFVLKYPYQWLVLEPVFAQDMGRG